MRDFVNFKGHLTIQTIKDGEVIDEWAEDNLIMETGRINMADYISGMNTGNYINKIVLGTQGHNGDYDIVKTSVEGYIKDRDRLFSEYTSYTSGVIPVVNIGDIFYNTGNSTYYRYILTSQATNVTPTFTDIATWEVTTAPFTYPIEFSTTGVVGDFNLVSEPDSVNTTIVNVARNASTVTYTIDVPLENANNGDVEVYSEAALYAGTYIFSTKCFKGKIKDDAVQLRFIWKIIF